MLILYSSLKFKIVLQNNNNNDILIIKNKF